MGLALSCGVADNGIILYAVAVTLLRVSRSARVRFRLVLLPTTAKPLPVQRPVSSACSWTRESSVFAINPSLSGASKPVMAGVRPVPRGSEE
jgi:hypothetical protein